MLRHLIAPRSFGRGFCYTSLMNFSWAGRMRFMIIGAISLVLVVLISVTAFAFMYRVPSCADQKQNQDEQGIDCGGSCSYLCTAQVTPPLEVFTRALTLPGGRTDVVAYIQNSNKTAEAKAAPYTLELYSADALVLRRIQGTVDLPAGSLVPIYVRAATQGAVVARAFISFSPENVHWRNPKKTHELPRVTESALIEGGTPRITARLVNEGFEPLYGVRAIAVVYDAFGTAIAASETLVPAISAQSSAPLTFTWNEPFSAPVSRFEIMPVVPLP